jgi:hypothetical protein
MDGTPGFVRMYGTVTPRSVGSTTVLRATTGASRFGRVVRIRRGGLYRALVQVNNGKQVSGHSQAILIG